jgi:hypothetical protein
MVGKRGMVITLEQNCCESGALPDSVLEAKAAKEGMNGSRDK